SLRSSGARPLPTDAEPLAIGLLAMGGVGGSGRVARAVARGLADRGHHVHLFSSDDPHWNDSQLDWVTTHRIGLQDTPQPPERVDAAAAARLAEQLRRHQLRVLNVHYASGLLGVALAARDRLGRAGLGVRVCASLHGTDVTSWTSPDERALEGHAPLASGDALTSRRVLAEQLRRCDAITTVSRWLAVRARAAFDLPEEPIVIPNAVESRLFHPRPARALRARLTRDDDELLLAHVSNLRPVKRSGDAVELLARVRAAGVPARLVLMGDGPEAAAVTRLAAALGVREHVHMTGALQPGPLARHLAACDLALVTSASESFSLAALEAMACGLPVLGTRCGGLEEVVQRLERADEPRADERVEPGPLSRLLVDVGDVAAMAARVLELLGSDAELRAISELLLRASLGPFREHAQVARYLAVYRGALRTDDARDRDGRGTLDAAPACP
ncbi:MAG: glycosyltransferase, partial [Myxococcales bacterium]|nr:glycosyltransferase [Myxococcales bacterium]